MRFCLSVLMAIILLMMATLSEAIAKEWETFKSDHFIVNYRQSVPEDFVNTVMESAEDSLKQVKENVGVSGSLNWSYDGRVLIYIYQDQEDYIKNSGQAGWSHGATIAGSKMIATFPSDEGFFDTLLPHELGHLVLYSYLGPNAEIPLWFNEGIAMNQEKAKRIGSHKMVQKSLVKGQFIPLTELADMRLYKDSPVETVQQYYAESASIVNFMIVQLGETRFRRFCRELKEGTNFKEALSRIYVQFDGLDGLNKKWVDYLKDHS